MSASISESASASSAANANTELTQHQTDLRAENARLKAEQKRYEAIIILLGGKPVTADLGDDKDGMGGGLGLDSGLDSGPGDLGFETISSDAASNLATSLDEVALSGDLSPAEILTLAQNYAGGTDELIDLLARAETSANPASMLNALSEALFQRAEGTDLGDAAAARHAAQADAPQSSEPSLTSQAARHAVLSAQEALHNGGNMWANFDTDYAQFLIGPGTRSDDDEPLPLRA